MKIYLSLFLTLILFAVNSLIAKYVLLQGYADPLSFSSLRLLSGGLILLPVVWGHFKKKETVFIKRSNLISAVCLLSYAVLFSYAYTSLDAGLGALILFGSVQVSMFGISRIQGKRFKLRDYIGLIVAFSGLVYLVNPATGVELDLNSAALMALSGLSWGIYSLVGSQCKSPVTDCSISFALLLPISLIILFFNHQDLTLIGAELSIISGAITSGLAYCLWYTVSSKVDVSTSSILQISVPVFATVMGVIFLDEKVTISFVISAFIIALGIFIKSYPSSKRV